MSDPVQRATPAIHAAYRGERGAADAADVWLDQAAGSVSDGDTALLVTVLAAEVRRLSSLPALRTCGDCAHYADVRDGQCEHPAGSDHHDTGRNDAPPAWCPLRRST